MKTSLLTALLLLGAGCATSNAHRPAGAAPPPSSAVLQTYGYEDIVQLGNEYVGDRYANARFETAEQLYPNYWRLRFGLDRADGKRTLVLEFDGTQRRWVKEEEVFGLSATPR